MGPNVGVPPVHDIVDLRFAALGRALPADHGYGLYAAVSSVVPAAHRAPWLGIHPVRGLLGVDGLLRLSARATLGVRVPAARIGEMLSLAGKTLSVGGHSIHIGVPRVLPLRPSSSLDARLVIIKLTKVPRSDLGSLDKVAFRAAFLSELRRQLARLGIKADVELLGKQEVRVGGRRVVGFTVRLSNLNPEHSLLVQASGLGGKRRMGCGIFVPTRVSRAPG